VVAEGRDLLAQRIQLVCAGQGLPARPAGRGAGEIEPQAPVVGALGDGRAKAGLSLAVPAQSKLCTPEQLPRLRRPRRPALGSTRGGGGSLPVACPGGLGALRKLEVGGE